LARINPADAVDILKREHTKRSTETKRRRIGRIQLDLIEEEKKAFEVGGALGVIWWLIQDVVAGNLERLMNLYQPTTGLPGRE